MKATRFSARQVLASLQTKVNVITVVTPFKDTVVCNVESSQMWMCAARLARSGTCWTTDSRAFVFVHHAAVRLPHVLPQVASSGQQPFA